MKLNIPSPLLCDGYKVGHKDQYPKNATLVFSNMTARGTRVKGLEKVTTFGLQYFLQRYLVDEWNTNFFGKDIEDVCKRYTRRLNNYLGPNRIGEQHIRDLHTLGYLPLTFWALPEGSSVNLRVPSFVVWNTHPNFAWMTNAIETIVSVSTWLPATSATTAVMYRKIFEKWARQTNTAMLGFVPWQGHDFSYRGHGSHESAVISGAGHALSFTGSDTVPVADFLEEYYDADSDKELIIGSVPATEHSVMCMGGNSSKRQVIPAKAGYPLSKALESIKVNPNLYLLATQVNDSTEDGTYSSTETDGDSDNFYNYFTVKDGKIVSIGHETPKEGGTYWLEGMQYDQPEKVIEVNSEEETFRRLIEDIYPDGIVSIVSDTWNLWEVINPEGGILTRLKDKVMARNGKVVIRPDSGDPVKIVTGYTENEIVRVGNKIYLYTPDSGKKGETAEIGREISEIECKGLIQCLYEIFGGTKTAEGYIQLDEHIGAIYGDSITLERAEQICQRLADKGFASTNLVYGIGSFTYQGAVTADAIVTRDTHCYAVKSTYGEVVHDIEGRQVTECIEIFKDPITDSGMKKSAKGLLAVYEKNGDFVLKDQATWDEVTNCAFDEVWTNGKFVKRHTLAEIRERVAQNWA